MPSAPLESKKGQRDNKRKKLTHEIVCGFRVDCIEICYIPHIVGYLWDTQDTNIDPHSGRKIVNVFVPVVSHRVNFSLFAA